MLGVSGDVEKLSFDRLCDNLDPRSGEQLTLRTKSDPAVGYDFIFPLSRGVSLQRRQEERLDGRIVRLRFVQPCQTAEARGGVEMVWSEFFFRGSPAPSGTCPVSRWREYFGTRLAGMCSIPQAREFPE